jgi:hypothetical protein
LRASMFAQLDPRLDPDSALKRGEQYASAALGHLKEAGRIDPAYSIRRLKLTDPWWKDALKRPGFKEAIDEMNGRAKPGVD